MIVIDASAMAECLVGQTPDPDLLAGLAGSLSAPHLLDIEILSVVRGLTLGGRLRLELADQARADYFAFTIDRFETEPLAERIWQLRHRCTAYDASYVALAEALSVPLFTCDRKLDSPGHWADVRVFGRNGSGRLTP